MRKDPSGSPPARARGQSRRRLALVGLVAGVAGVAAAHAATTLLALRANPVVAVAEAIIEHTPGSLAERLIGIVGQYDKPILVAGVSAGLLALSAYAGVLARRSALGPLLVFLAMGAVGVLAEVSREGASTSDAMPAVVGALTWIVVLTMLVDRLPATAPTPAAPTELDGGEDPSGTHARWRDRRGFLIRVGVVGLGAAMLGTGGEVFGRARRSVETSRRLLRLPVRRGAVRREVSLDDLGLPPWRTPNRDFYRIDTNLIVPAVEPMQWSLRIHGMVEREIRLGYQDLLARRMTETWVTLCCVSNPVGGELIGNAYWSGVRVADLLAEAGVSPSADAVLQTSTDGWDCGTPLAALTDDRNALLAVAMNGEPLPVEHGFPVRMVVPGLFGYVSATKWLTDLEVTQFAKFEAYWTQRGWSSKGPVRTESRIDVPYRGKTVPAGLVRVGGSAWAQHTGIAKVEFQVDGGAWAEAELGRVPNEDTWVQWVGTTEVGAGKHRVRVRATDKSGYTQTSVRRDVIPSGATGWDSVEFSAE